MVTMITAVTSWAGTTIVVTSTIVIGEVTGTSSFAVRRTSVLGIGAAV